MNSLAASVCDISDCKLLDGESVHSLAASVYVDQVECLTLELDQSMVSNSSDVLELPTQVAGTSQHEGSQRVRWPVESRIGDTEGVSISTDDLLDDCTQVRTKLSHGSNSHNVVDDACVQVTIPPVNPCPIAFRLCDPLELRGVKSQMKPATWSYYLEYEDNIEIRDYLHRGIHEGFDIVDRDVDIATYECENYNSCINGPAFEYVDKLIQKEITDEKFVVASDKPNCVHALGAIPKSNGSYRPITDCRRPLYRSINNYMDTTSETFCYASTDHVCDMMSLGGYMATVDIASAYRSVSINPDQWLYQGIKWSVQGEPTYLYDVRLSFGLRCAPFIFTQLSDFVVRTMGRLGYTNVISYIDDFIVVEPTRERCADSQAILFELLGSLGFEVSWTKCAAPSTRVRYLGIDFDSMDMTLSLPKDKLNKLFKELDFFEGKSRATKGQIQRLCGILAHASKVVRGGRVFSRRIIYLLKDLPQGNPRVCISDDFLLDLQWWRQFSANFNGKAQLIQNNFGQGPELFTDACLKGYGFVCGLDWQAGAFLEEYVNDNYVERENLCVEHTHWLNVTVHGDDSINYLELVAIYLALLRLAPSWENQHVLCYTDNTQAMSAVNRGTSVSKDSMNVIRQIFWICANYNIYLSACHIAGEINLLADWLSRACIRGFIGIDGLPLCCRVAGTAR